MKINRHNYEEYFILYTDKELSHDDKKMVDLFVSQHPDLEEELIMLQQSKLVPDEAVVFDGKESLFQSITPSIDLATYKDWLLLYTDNELSASEKNEVENFIAKHPGIKAELDLLQTTLLQPDTAIVFPDKTSLYRREEKVRVVAINWRRIAVAAAVFLSIGIAAFFIYNKDTATTGGTIAIETKPIREASPMVQPVPGEKATATAPVTSSEPVEAPALASRTKIKTTTGKPAQEEDKTPIESKEEKDEVLLASAIENKNNLPQPAYNPNMTTPLEKTAAIAEMDMPSKKALTNSQENISIKNVTPEFASALHSPNELIDVTQSEKKNALRGLLRKVTRTFEKTTNIKATDDEDRLLIAGLAIKL